MRPIPMPFSLALPILLVSFGAAAGPPPALRQAPAAGPSAQAETPAQDPAVAQAPASDADLAAAAASEREAAILAVAASVNGELADIAAYRLPPEEVVLAIERVADDLERREALLLESTEGRTFLVRTLFRAAEVLSSPEVDARAAAIRLAEKAVGLVDGMTAANGQDREVKSLVGEVYVGRGRIALARGDAQAAIVEFEKAAEILEEADKDRGTGTGSSEFRGSGEGDGKGRGRGKGRNKDRSLAAKRYLTGLYRDLARAYVQVGNSEQELWTFQRERLIVGKLCQMEHGSPAPRFEEARFEMARLIDRLGDATERHGDADDAVRVEVLSMHILREIYEAQPTLRRYLEALVEQEVEIARRQADLRQITDLRETVAQAEIDAQVLENAGLAHTEVLGFQARLRLQMARGLMTAVAGGKTELRDEAMNWFSSVSELIETIRSEGGSITAQLAEVEEAAKRGLAEASAGN